MVDLVAQLFHDLLDDHEIEHEPGVFVELSLERDTRAIVVAVEALAPVAGKRDEMRRREDEMVLCDRYLELTTPRHFFLPNHSRIRCSGQLSTTEDTGDTEDRPCSSGIQPPCPPCPPWWLGCIVISHGC